MNPEAETNPGIPETRTTVALGLGALAVLVSGWVHFYLYFRGGYRGIAPESFAGITISRSFAVNAIAAVVIAEGVLVSVRWRELRFPAAAAGAGFAVATIVAYVLSRTVGLLGFEESSTTTYSVIALIAEGIALVTLAPVALVGLRDAARQRTYRLRSG